MRNGFSTAANDCATLSTYDIYFDKIESSMLTNKSKVHLIEVYFMNVEPLDFH